MTAAPVCAHCGGPAMRADCALKGDTATHVKLLGLAPRTSPSLRHVGAFGRRSEADFRGAAQLCGVTSSRLCRERCWDFPLGPGSMLGGFPGQGAGAAKRLQRRRAAPRGALRNAFSLLALACHGPRGTDIGQTWLGGAPWHALPCQVLRVKLFIYPPSPSHSFP